MGDIERVLLKPEEVSRLTGYSRSKIYDLIAKGELPSVRLGERGIRVPADAIRRLAQVALAPR